MKITAEMLKGVTVLDDITDYFTVGITKSDITEVDIPNSVKKIGVGVFSGCRNLKSITIPNSVTELGKWAFDECKSLEMFIVPKDFNKTNKEIYKQLKNIYIGVKICYKK